MRVARMELRNRFTTVVGAIMVLGLLAQTGSAQDLNEKQGNDKTTPAAVRGRTVTLAVSALTEENKQTVPTRRATTQATTQPSRTGQPLK